VGKNISIEERAINLAHYIIDTGDTVRGAAKKFGISKSTVHTEVTLRNGRTKSVGANSIRPNFVGNDPKEIPESIEIKGVFLSVKNPVVKLGMLIK